MPEHSFPVVFAPQVSVRDPRAIQPAQFRAQVLKAVEFVASGDRKCPSLYSRLELGSSWEHVLLLFSKTFF